ncbi:MAG: Gfo/Idh/MocA family protein [Planctomycetota bacterium]|jgi:predicted dehydrogenase
MKETKKTTRRRFLKASLAGAAGAGIASGLSTWSRVLGANEDIRVGQVGFRGQGGGHIKRYQRIKGVRVVALCDVDKDVLNKKVRDFEKRKQKVEAYTDVRKMLENKDIDAISVATPNHWHALATIWGCQAGKDVYVEKPCSHNVWEGRKMIEAARKYNRIVQIGTQKRSAMGLKAVYEELQKGLLGKILCSRGFCYKPRGSIGQVSGPQKPPSSVDYDIWCGPAPNKPLMRKRLHYDWHWIWDTGNGDLGNQGIHEMDLARWALGGEERLAPAVMSIGGRLGYIDDGETANTHIIFLDFKPAPLIFEVRGLPMKKGSRAMDNYRGTRIGMAVLCEGGYFVGGGHGGYTYDKQGKKIKQYRGGGGDHQNNFIKAVRSRKVSDLNADIEKGHYSSALCHMGNVSHRVGTEKHPDEIMEIVKGNGELEDSFQRFMSHIKANEVDLRKTPITLGPMLKMDTEKEKFVGAYSSRANELVTRNYREPFVVPERV